MGKMNVEFVCDLGGKPTPLKHFWKYCVGSDHAPVALRSDWQTQLQRCHDELGFERVRFHGLLSDDLGTLVREKDELIYSFFNADQIFDFLVSIGMHPFVELSFMPTALASGAKTVFHYHANVTPPKDYKEWARLIKRLVRHWLDRYGLAEMKQWNFEVWNEPNLKAFWTGTKRDYFKFYRYTAEAIKEVDSSLMVGGPATAKNEWVEEFRKFCERNDVPLDFISTHHYPTDAFGKPDDDTEMQLSKSRRGALRDQALDAKRGAARLPLYYTEWNSSSNPFDHLHDESYAAAFAIKSVMDVAGVVEGYSFWTFSDIFEENYFSSVPFHGGFGLLNIHGIAKPVYRAFQLLQRVGHEQLRIDGLHETVNIWALGDNAKLTILMSNHALPGHSIENERIAMVLLNASRPRAAWIERIDEEHANADSAWSKMGKPDYLDKKSLAALNAASEIVRQQQRFRYEKSQIAFEVTLPPHGVAAIEFHFRK
jgi:xylan 1,4-beta-xylosidase